MIIMNPVSECVRGGGGIGSSAADVLKIALHVVGVSVVHVKTFVQVYYF